MKFINTCRDEILVSQVLDTQIKTEPVFFSNTKHSNNATIPVFRNATSELLYTIF